MAAESFLQSLQKIATAMHRLHEVADTCAKCVSPWPLDWKSWRSNWLK